MEPTNSQQCPQASSSNGNSSTKLTLNPQTPTTVTSTSSPSVVTIPVPIVPSEEIYSYVIVKGSLHDQNASIFGLNFEETIALSKRFARGSTEIVNGEFLLLLLIVFYVTFISYKCM